jgi:hypothetical protein
VIQRKFHEYAPTCIECGKVGRLVDGRAVYPDRRDLHDKFFYKCACGAYVGCHPGTMKALGFPAGSLTRAARGQAHEAFDPLWRSGRIKRDFAYRWLAAKLGIPGSQCHMSWFDAETCKRVVEAVPSLIAEAPKGPSIFGKRSYGKEA